MSPERSGTVPLGKLYKAIFNNEYTLEEIKKMNYGRGGLVAHLNSNDGREISKKIDAGDKRAELVYEALAYQVAKEIGSAAAVLEGDVDAIIITGGLAYDQRLVAWIKKRVKNYKKNYREVLIFDKLVGKAGALFLREYQPKYIYAQVITKEAFEILKEFDVEYDNIVDNIMNRDKSDLCPLELIAKDCESVEEVYDKTFIFYSKLGVLK